MANPCDAHGSASPPDRGLPRLAAVLAIAVLVGLAWPMFQGAFYPSYDLARTYYAPYAFYRDCLRSGRSFLWYPYFYGGFHLHGEGQWGLLHPINLLTFGLLPLSVALNLAMIRGHVCLLLGTFFFLRRWSSARRRRPTERCARPSPARDCSTTTRSA